MTVVAAPLSPAVRAMTASRTVDGMSPLGAAITSVTKNGLPAVARYNAVASMPCGAASAATASGDNGRAVSLRIEGGLRSSPRSRRSGWVRSSSSSR